MECFQGIVFIPPTVLYNLLQQGLDYPNLSDPNYLLMLDSRGKDAYNESHIITAKRAPQDEDRWAMLPFDSEIECRINIVVYDSNTSIDSEPGGPAISCAQYIWNLGSKDRVKILDGGYEEFSALYPFLRTQKIIYMPRELDDLQTYPAEIVPGLLYLGNRRHGNAAYIQKDLKIQAHINCSVQPGEIFSEPGDELLHIAIEDSPESDISVFFKPAIVFINKHLSLKKPVLVYSEKGISRSPTIIIAFIIYMQANSLKTAYNYVRDCSAKIRPNKAFINQLSHYEAQSYGASITETTNLHF